MGDDESLQAERDKLESSLTQKPAVICFAAADLRIGAAGESGINL